MPIITGVPAYVAELSQTGLLQRAFHDGLVPQFSYRAEAVKDQWEANTGTEVFMSRPGLLTPVTKPRAPGVDPEPQAVSYEQWVARLERYSGAIDTHMPTSTAAMSDLFLRNITQLGLQAGQSINRIARNALFKSYLSGSTNLMAAAGSTDTTIRVSSINGFTDVVVKDTNVRPRAVSSTSPLAITIVIAGVSTAFNVTGAVPDYADDPYGPGTLTLSAAIGGSGAALGSPVLSGARPRILRAGGGDSIDAIGSGDLVTLQDFITATNRLRQNNVLPHEDGFYHAHISPMSNTQIFADEAFQRLNTARPDHVYFQEAFVGTIGNIMFVMNTESPDSTNTGTRRATRSSAYYSEDIGAETTNASGVNIGRIIVTGRGALYERYLDERKYVSEAGVTGKIGEFQVVNQGIEINLENIRLAIRSPIDRLMDMVSAAWSITTSFPVPSDVTSGGAERFKRGLVIEHAID